MKKCIVASVLLLAFFMVAQEPARAEGQAYFFAGYLEPEHVNFDNVLNTVRTRGNGLYGARVEFGFWKVLALEQGIAFTPRLLSSSLFPAAVDDIHGVLYNSNIVAKAKLGRFVPFATIGFGFIKPWGSGLEPFDFTFAGNVGAGVRMDRLLGPMGLRFEARGWRSGDIAGQGDTNFLEATGGLTFTWGR